MGGKVKVMPRAMVPVEEVDVATAWYEPLVLRVPRLTWFPLRAYVWLLQSPLLGPLITSVLKKQNNMTQMLQRTVIPDRTMFFPEYPLQEPEQGVATLGDDRDPVERVEEALQCLAPYDPSQRFASANEKDHFLYWKICDFARAYRSGITTPQLLRSMS